jgi:hypothetical protein
MRMIDEIYLSIVIATFALVAMKLISSALP